MSARPRAVTFGELMLRLSPPGDERLFTFRWFGASNAIPLASIRQIPGVEGVVSALYDVPVGAAWPRDALA